MDSLQLPSDVSLKQKILEGKLSDVFRQFKDIDCNQQSSSIDIEEMEEDACKKSDNNSDMDSDGSHDLGGEETTSLPQRLPNDVSFIGASAPVK